MGNGFGGFGRRADEFIGQVKAEEIGPSTDVLLIYRCADQQGHELPPFRVSLAPTTKVEGAGNSEAAVRFATSLHVGTICGNINSMVRHLPSGPIRIDGGPPYPVIVQDVELEIVQPTA